MIETSIRIEHESNGRQTAPKRSFRRGRLSEQVVAELERTIRDEYPDPGSRLPKEAELADRFHVSRIVAISPAQAFSEAERSRNDTISWRDTE